MFKLLNKETCLAQKLPELQPCSHQLQPRFDVDARLLGLGNSGTRPLSNPLIYYVVPDGEQIESPAISIETWLQCLNKNWFLHI